MGIGITVSIECHSTIEKDRFFCTSRFILDTKKGVKRILSRKASYDKNSFKFIMFTVKNYLQ